MDSQKTNEESLPKSEKELPSNIIDLILSDDLEKDSKLEIEEKLKENDENAHTETKQTGNRQTIFTPEEEEKNGDIDRNLKYKSNVEEETTENENFEKLEENTTENTSEKRVVNGIFTDDSAGKSLELLWAEAIKAQNEGRYKDAIHNFTQIYEVSNLCLQIALTLNMTVYFKTIRSNNTNTNTLPFFRTSIPRQN